MKLVDIGATCRRGRKVILVTLWSFEQVTEGTFRKCIAEANYVY